MEKEIKIFSWLAYDSNFKPGVMNSKFKNWANRGLNILSNLIKKGEIISFQNLRQKFDLEHQDFYMYLQVRDHYQREIMPDLPGEINVITEILGCAYRNKGEKLISKLYQGLVSNRRTSILYIRDKWKK